MTQDYSPIPCCRAAVKWKKINPIRYPRDHALARSRSESVGKPQQIRVQRSLGMGLDEKAIEAVRQWRFEPAKKDGQPVPVMINVEVNFRLY